MEPATLETIERALSDIELAMEAEQLPREIVRAYQKLSAAVADYRSIDDDRLLRSLTWALEI